MNYLRYFVKITIIITIISLSGDLFATMHRPDEKVTDWKIALQYLTEGNQRYVENRSNAYLSNEEDRSSLLDGQNPFAVILTCSDSRVAPEIFFDQRLGDIFVVRNAGNIYHPIALGSIEYAVDHLEVPLVVVVGHSQCGAVTGAFTGAQPGGNLQNILNIVVEHIEGCEDIDEAIYKNISSVVENIKKNTSQIEQETMVIGAYFDIATGLVTFY